MRLVCIDTSSQTESLALTEHGDVVVEMAAHRAKGHASALLPDLNQLLSEANWNWRDVEGIAIGLGPGGFTSLRIGLATAKSLAYSLKIPLFGATTLAMLAARFQHPDVMPLIDAKRGEVYVQGSDHRLHCKHPEKLSSVLNPNTPYLFCGDGALKYTDTLRAIFTRASIDDDASKNQPRAATLAHLIDVERPENLSTLQPNYVRPSDAELTYPTGFPDAVKQFQF